MRFRYAYRNSPLSVWPAAVFLWILLAVHGAAASDYFDVVSGVLESPRFKGKGPLQKLLIAAELIRTNKLKQSDMAFPLLDWTDEYLRAPSNLVERLKRWAELTGDEKLGHLRLPRDYFNRMLLAEYLVSQTSYLNVSPREKLGLLRKLDEEKLVDWSVFLAYARIYAGGVIMGAQKYNKTQPKQALHTLKTLRDEGLVDWHYRIPTESILVAEALALDDEYQRGSNGRRLGKIRNLEKKGLISPLTRKELEKLPAWRMLIQDAAFLKANLKLRRQKLDKLKEDGLISASTASDLMEVFSPQQMPSQVETGPAPLPRKIPPPSN